MKLKICVLVGKNTLKDMLQAMVINNHESPFTGTLKIDKVGEIGEDAQNSHRAGISCMP